LGLTFRLFIHFELSWSILRDRHGSSFSFLQMDNHFSQEHLLESVFSPSYIFGPFVKNKVGIVVWIHIRVLYSIPLVFSLFLCQYHTVFIAIAL
jgi:hypothetical protein